MHACHLRHALAHLLMVAPLAFVVATHAHHQNTVANALKRRHNWEHHVQVVAMVKLNHLHGGTDATAV
jgi:hypothetical protein